MAEKSHTESKMGHTAAVSNQTNQTPATAFKGSSQENPTSVQGASNPATGRGTSIPDGPAQEIAGTLSQDFTLKGMKAEYKGGDQVHPDPVGGDASASSFGTGGHQTHQPMQSHEVDMPDTPNIVRLGPSVDTGDNKTRTH